MINLYIKFINYENKSWIKRRITEREIRLTVWPSSKLKSNFERAWEKSFCVKLRPSSGLSMARSHLSSAAARRLSFFLGTTANAHCTLLPLEAEAEEEEDEEEGNTLFNLFPPNPHPPTNPRWGLGRGSFKTEPDMHCATAAMDGQRRRRRRRRRSKQEWMNEWYK